MTLQPPQIQDEIKIIKIFETTITTNMNRKQVLKILRKLENTTINPQRLQSGYAGIHIERTYGDWQNREEYRLSFENENLSVISLTTSGYKCMFVSPKVKEHEEFVKRKFS